MKDLMIYLAGLVCGMILMGVALGDTTTTAYVVRSIQKNFAMDVYESDDRYVAEHWMKKWEEGAPMKDRIGQLVERTCTDRVLSGGNRKP